MVAVFAVVAGLVVMAGCSSTGTHATLTCQFTLGTESARVVLDSASTGRTSLGLGHLTGQLSRAGGEIRMSIFGPSPRDGGVFISDGTAMRIGAQVSGGFLRGSCRQ